jgi:uncharacterized protein YbjT (DUF2867 family)
LLIHFDSDIVTIHGELILRSVTIKQHGKFNIMKQSPILIIGKNGKTGFRVNQRLQALGYATRPVSRSTIPSFDWENSATWRSAIEGTRAAYVTYQPDLAVPNAEPAIKEFVRVAADAGLEHIVLLSGRGEEGAQRAEQVLKTSGISWNIVRASWFAQNFSESFMLEGILAGELVLPAGDIVEPFIDIDDIAEVAVAALTEPDLRNKLFEVTGPRAMTFAQCIEELSEAIGHPEEIRDHFYGISVERKITHPAVVAITETARAWLSQEANQGSAARGNIRNRKKRAHKRKPRNLKTDHV